MRLARLFPLLAVTLLAACDGSSITGTTGNPDPTGAYVLYSIDGRRLPAQIAYPDGFGGYDYYTVTNGTLTLDSQGAATQVYNYQGGSVSTFQGIWSLPANERNTLRFTWQNGDGTVTTQYAEYNRSLIVLDEFGQAVEYRRY